MSVKKVLYTSYLTLDLCHEILSDKDSSHTLIDMASFLVAILTRDFSSMEGYEAVIEDGRLVGVAERASD